MKKLTRIFAVLFISVALVACSDDGDGSNNQTPADTGQADTGQADTGASDASDADETTDTSDTSTPEDIGEDADDDVSVTDGATDADSCGGCDDGVDCTVDTCDNGTCTFTSADSLCSGDDVCDATNGCQAPLECTEDADCDDANICTANTCVDGACVFADDDSSSCDDGDACTGGDMCSAGACEPTTELCCADGADNDRDGQIDCADSDCIGGADCPTYTIDWCNLQWPPSMTLSAGGAEPAYSQLYISGQTDGQDTAFTAPTLVAQIGVGPDGSDPTTSTAWTWTSAQPNVGYDFTQNNDEYTADVTAPAGAGSYDYAFRYSGDNGQTWTYCDQNAGATDGYQPAEAGDLTVQ